MPGRGGAGNIEAANQAASKVLPTSRSVAEEGKSSNSPLAQAQQQEYAHSGRGGAGNYYSPKQLAEEGAFSTNDRHGPAPDEAPMVGRGGAGNFRVDEQTLGGRDAGADDPDLRARIERDLEKGMPQAPTPAHVRARPEQPAGEQHRGDVEALDAAAR